MGENNTNLAGEIKKGNRQALKKLYERYHMQLYYLGKRYLKNKELAEDAVQDVFLKVWDKRKKIDPTLSIEGFLFTTLKNHVLNMVRDEGKRKKIIEEVKQTAQTGKSVQTVEEEIIYSEYEDFLNKAINKLSPAEQKVFKLRSIEGLSNEEIAKKRKVSQNTVKTQYYLSSKLVRNYLKKHAGLFTSVLMLLQL